MDDMNSLKETDFGKIMIAPQVIEIISKNSTLDIEGVVSLSSNFELTDLFGRTKTATKGIKVRLDDDEVKIDISVSIKKGYNIPDLAKKIQENVKRTIEIMTDLDVEEVNIHINGIEFDEIKE